MLHHNIRCAYSVSASVLSGDQVCKCAGDSCSVHVFTVVVVMLNIVKRFVGYT